MIPDWAPQKKNFILRVPAEERALVNGLMNDHGLEFSLSASTPEVATLFTGEEYAAVTFFEHATPAAAEQLRDPHERIQSSWAPESSASSSVFLKTKNSGHFSALISHTLCSASTRWLAISPAWQNADCHRLCKRNSCA